MKINTIGNFESFCREIENIGFCLSGENGEGVFSVKEFYTDDIVYHTGDQDLDPWAWRIRALLEKDFLCYGKFFMKKAGWITKDWITDFVSVRRKGMSVEELYQNGMISPMDREVYNLIVANKRMPLNRINEHIGISKKKEVAKALVNLQMMILITVCDDEYKVSKEGLPYGWPATVFCSIESFVGYDVSEKARNQDPRDANKRIRDQLLVLNPSISERKVKTFIKKLI